MPSNQSKSMRIGLITGVSALAIVAASIVAVPAFAAESNAAGANKDKTASADSSKSGIPEITVTAQFRQQNLQTTPIAITAITGEMLQARSQTSITDITAQAPNVQLQQNAAGGGNSMRAFIRGVGQSDQDPAVDPGVGIYIDDVYFASITGSIFDLMDLDRVEILRGPQGTLSGMNSLGGSVKLFSKKPSGHGGYVEGTAGSLRRTDVRAAGDFTIIPDRLFVRIAGVSRHHKGYVTRYDYACLHPTDPDVISGAIPRDNSGQDCKLGTLGGQSMTALRAQVRWLPTDKLEINVSADGTDDNSESTAATLLSAGEFIPGLSRSYSGIPYDNRYVSWGPNAGDTVLHSPYVSYANFSDPAVTYTPIDTAGTPGASNGAYNIPPENKMHAWGLNGNIDYQIDDNTSLKSITGYRSYTSRSANDNDGSPAPILLGLDTLRHKQFSEEVRLTGSVSTPPSFPSGCLRTFSLSRSSTSSRTIRPSTNGMPVSRMPSGT
jgi:iron complex outermembrane receptor protein